MERNESLVSIAVCGTFIIIFYFLTETAINIWGKVLP